MRRPPISGRLRYICTETATLLHTGTSMQRTMMMRESRTQNAYLSETVTAL